MKPELKKKALQRLRILEGQIRGLQQMVEKEKYCLDILQQTAAVKAALSSLENLILQNHLETHILEQIQAGNEQRIKEEFLTIYRLAKKQGGTN